MTRQVSVSMCVSYCEWTCDEKSSLCALRRASWSGELKKAWKTEHRFHISHDVSEEVGSE